MDYLQPYIYFIVVALFASLRIYSKKIGGYPYLKTFPVYLLITLLVELLGSYFSYVRVNNLTLYNVFSIVSICYFLWLVSRMLESRRSKRTIRIIISVYIIFSAVNLLYIQKGEFNTISYGLGCILIVYFSIFFFLQLFRQPASVALTSYPDFWICTAIMFWYCCGFPLYGFINFWTVNSAFVANNFGPIVTILNIFLYSLFTIAFICMKTRKYFSSPS